MTARIFILASAILALAAPFATAASHQQVSPEAVMTLRSLGGGSWRFDIQNTTATPVTIDQVTWTAPDGLTVDRIKKSSGGTCRLSGSGFQCQTKLAAPSCRTCVGQELTVDFKGFASAKISPFAPQGFQLAFPNAPFWAPEPYWTRPYWATPYWVPESGAAQLPSTLGSKRNQSGAGSPETHSIRHYGLQWKCIFGRV